MESFNAFHSANATLAGIEVAHMIRKSQSAATDLFSIQELANLVA
jgi:putative transposase